MTHVDLRTLRLAPGDHHRHEVPVTISPFTAGAQEYRAEPSEVRADLGLTRLAGGLLFDLTFDVTIVGPCQRCLEDARELVEVRAREYQADTVEVEVTGAPGQEVVRVQPKVVDAGHHSRRLMLLTGLDVQENQARRLLNDLRSWRAWLEQRDGAVVSETVAGHRWVSEIYAPVVESIPPELVGRLAPAEVFHEILEHRWFLSEQAGADVGTTAAARSYFETVLPESAPEVTSPSAMLGLLAL